MRPSMVTARVAAVLNARESCQHVSPWRLVMSSLMRVMRVTNGEMRVVAANGEKKEMAA